MSKAKSLYQFVVAIAVFLGSTSFGQYQPGTRPPQGAFIGRPGLAAGGPIVIVRPPVFPPVYGPFPPPAPRIVTGGFVGVGGMMGPGVGGIGGGPGVGGVMDGGPGVGGMGGGPGVGGMGGGPGVGGMGGGPGVGGGGGGAIAGGNGGQGNGGGGGGRYPGLGGGSGGVVATGNGGVGNGQGGAMNGGGGMAGQGGGNFGGGQGAMGGGQGGGNFGGGGQGGNGQSSGQNGQQQGQDQLSVVRILSDINSEFVTLERLLQNIPTNFPKAQNMLIAELQQNPAPTYLPYLKQVMLSTPANGRKRTALSGQASKINFAAWTIQLRKSVQSIKTSWDNRQYNGSKQMGEVYKQMDGYYVQSLISIFIATEMVKRAYVIPQSQQLAVAAEEQVMQLIGYADRMFRRFHFLHKSQELSGYFNGGQGQQQGNQGQQQQEVQTFETQYQNQFNIKLNIDSEESVAEYKRNSLNRALDIASYLAPLDDANAGQNQNQDQQQRASYPEPLADYPGSDGVDTDEQLSNSLQTLDSNVRDPKVSALLRELLNIVEGGEASKGGNYQPSQPVASDGNYIYNQRGGKRQAPPRRRAPSTEPAPAEPDYVADNPEVQQAIFELQELQRQKELQNNPEVAQRIQAILARLRPGRPPVKATPPPPRIEEVDPANQ